MGSSIPTVLVYEAIVQAEWVGRPMQDIVFLCDQVIENIARLHAFSQISAPNPQGDGDVQDDVDNVAELLASRDLLIFAACTRNFSEASRSVDKMRAQTVPTCRFQAPIGSPYFVEDASPITLYQALSRILHSHELRICRSPIDYLAFLAANEAAFLSGIQMLGSARHGLLEPTLFVLTKQDAPTLVRLGAILGATCVVLNEVSEILSSRDKIFLQRDFRS
jgi:hypothetical protein